MPAIPTRWTSRPARWRWSISSNSSRIGRSTAIVVTWDDSDGWYDHAFAKPTHTSFDAQADQLDGAGKCGTGTPPLGVDGKPGQRALRSGHAHSLPGDLALDGGQPCRSPRRSARPPWCASSRITGCTARGIGGGSFDATAGSLAGLFDFSRRQPNTALYLDPQSGAVREGRRRRRRQGKLGPPCASACRGIADYCRGNPAGFAAAPGPSQPDAQAAQVLLADGENPYPMKLQRPPSAPLSAMALVGQKIFFDASLFGSGKLACASCHDPARAYGPPGAAPAMLGGHESAAPGRPRRALADVSRTPAGLRRRPGR